MILHKNSLTDPDTNIRVQHHVDRETLVHVHSADDGSMVLSMGPLTIFFAENTDMELSHLILDWRKQNGKSY